jgi:hypothetical protein
MIAKTAVWAKQIDIYSLVGCYWKEITESISLPALSQGGDEVAE